jgi:hypothetical protein
VNITATRRRPTAADPRAERASSAPTSAPFAALPHDIAADSRLSPTDVRVILALLYYARSKAVCWPSDRSIALRIGRSVSTVGRSLRRLEALGLVAREPDDGNRTGRRLVLQWRQTPRVPMTDPLPPSMTDEGRREREGQGRAAVSGPETPTAPAENEEPGPEAPPSAEDLERFRRWAASGEPAMARFGRAALRLAGINPDAVVELVPAIERHGAEKGGHLSPTLDGPQSVSVGEPKDTGPAGTLAGPHGSTPTVASEISPMGEKKPGAAPACPATPTIASAASASLPYSIGIPRPAGSPARRQTPPVGRPRPGPMPVGSVLALWATKRAT